MPVIAKSTLEDMDKMKFVAETRSGHKVVMDAVPDVGGENEGPRPAEMPFVGLGGCTGMDVISILRKMRQKPSRFEVEVEGLERSEEHPKYWYEVRVTFYVDGDVEGTKLQKAIDLSRTRYCGVSAAMSNSVNLHYRYVLNGDIVDLPDAEHE